MHLDPVLSVNPPLFPVLREIKFIGCPDRLLGVLHGVVGDVDEAPLDEVYDDQGKRDENKEGKEK